MHQAKVASYKVERISELVKLIQSYQIVGIVNMENIPAPQLQRMRAQLKDKLLIAMSKKRLITRALDASESDKKDISALKQNIVGMPALIFTKENPFKLASILRKSKTSAPAKAGQTAPRDVLIPAGPTPFAPGPIISELSGVGLKTGVEGGKVTIRQDHMLVKEGEKISQKAADVMMKLGIQPMEIGLDMVAIYEKGIIYTKDVLSVDEQQYLNNILLAASEAQSLAVFIAYPAKETIKALVSKAYNDAKALALSKELVSDIVAHKLVVDAERQAESVKGMLPEGTLTAADINEKNNAKDSAKAEALSASDKLEKEIDRKIEDIKHDKEAEHMKKVEAVAREVLTKGKAEKKAEDEEFFDEVKMKMESDKEISKKLDGIKHAKENAKEQENAEHMFDELKKKGTLREKDKK